MMNMKKEVWGFCPPPIGGISIYCKRLAEKMAVRDKSFVMRNFAPSKSSSPYIVDVKNALIEFFKLPFVKKRIIHAQFTNFNLLLLLYLFGWKHKLVLTLHNRRLVLLKGWRRLVISRLLRRVKYVIFNDPTYIPSLVENFKIDEGKIVILPTYISPGEDEMKGLTPDIEDFIARHEYTLSANANRIIKNELFGDLYGIDQLIVLMDRLVNEDGLNAGMVFCISEIFNQGYYEECLDKINSLGLSEHFHFVIQSKVNGFEVWGATDLFLRPTMSDMEGVSVKEALQFGTPVVASDVCTRPREATTYVAGDTDDLYNKVSPLLLERKRVYYVPEVAVDEEVYRLYSLID